jgi:hypothetical protein
MKDTNPSSNFPKSVLLPSTLRAGTAQARLMEKEKRTKEKKK